MSPATRRSWDRATSQASTWRVASTYLLTDSGAALFQGWEISNLQFDGFDFSIGMFYSGGSGDAFDDVLIQNNFIRIPADVAAVGEEFQNIGLHVSFGSDQSVVGNVLEIAGDAPSDTAGSGTATPRSESS